MKLSDINFKGIDFKTLTANRGSAGAVGILLLLVVCGFGGLWFAHSVVELTWFEIEARQTEVDALVRRQEVARQPGRAQPVVTIDPFIEGTSFALAANTMQRRVVGVIEQTGGTLITIGIDPQATGDNDESRRVVVQAVAEMSIESLQELLYRLESSPPFVLVEAMNAARVASRDASEEAEEFNAPIRLAVNLRLTGYFRGVAR